MKQVRFGCEIQLTDEDQQLLEAVLVGSGVSADLLCQVAMEEYVGMVLGQKVFSRGADVLEHRAYLIVRNTLESDTDPERVIRALFQTTTTRARSMVRSLLAKYQYELRQILHRRLVRIIAADKVREEGDYEVFRCSSPIFVEAIKEKIHEFGLDDQIRATGKFQEYRIRPSVREDLVTRLDE